MNKNEFIEFVAKIAVKDWQDRRIVLPSITIAQACKESAFGTSELALNANALFGIKLNGWTGKSYRKKADEQNPDGTMRTDENALWRSYDNWEQSILDHSTYLAERKIGNQKEVNFKSVIGETNLKKSIAALVGNYNRNEIAERCTDAELKQYVKIGTTQYGYMTGLNYPQSLLDDYIRKYDLTKYDDIKNKGDIKSMKINVHAGHNPDGKIACGAVGLIKESTQARLVKDQVIQMLRSLGHTVYDCTVDNGKTQKDVLRKICAKCNANTVDLDVSIHFNSGANDRNGNGTTTGTEVLIYSDKTKAYAQNICNAISALGFKNRGVKYRTDLYFLKQTKAPALLIECCFVDDADDVKRYNASEMASAIVKGITGQSVGQKPENEPAVKHESKLYKVQCGAYSKKENAEELQKRLKASGFDAFIVEV